MSKGAQWNDILQYQSQKEGEQVREEKARVKAEKDYYRYPLPP